MLKQELPANGFRSIITSNFTLGFFLCVLVANLHLSDGKPTQVIEGIPMHIILGAPRQPEPYNDTYPMTSPLALQDGSIQFRLSIIADLDRKSKDANDSSTFNSYLKSGRFTIQPEWKGASIVWNDNSTISTGVGTENKTIDPDSSQALYYGAGGRINSQFAFGNRGMELSSLVTFNGKLYACEDRTGIIFQIVDHKVIPWVILADGNGTRPRGKYIPERLHMYVRFLQNFWSLL